MALRILANGTSRLSAARKVVMSIVPRQMASQPLPQSLIHLRRIQEDFQKDDGKTVWEKGPYDVLLYRTTMFLSVLGVICSLELMYDQAKPPAWRARDAAKAVEDAEDEAEDAGH